MCFILGSTQAEFNLFPLSFFLPLLDAQAIQSLFPRLPDSGRGTSLFDRGTTAPGPEGDKLRLDAFPFLSSGELIDGETFGARAKVGTFQYLRDKVFFMRKNTPCV